MPAEQSTLQFTRGWNTTVCDLVYLHLLGSLGECDADTWCGGKQEGQSMASGLKSSSRQNKEGIDAAVHHTVSKCLEKPLQDSEPPPGAILCVQGLRCLEARGRTHALQLFGAQRTKCCGVSRARDAKKLVSLHAGGGQTVFHQGSDVCAFWEWSELQVLPVQ